MTLRGWQAACTECEWRMHSIRREHADEAKRTHEHATGHKGVAVYPVRGDDPTGDRYASSDSPSTV